MKLIKFFALSFLVVVGITSCKPNVSPEISDLYAEVMKVHDDVMPEMGTIHKLRKKLKAQIKNKDLDSSLKDKYLGMIESLDAADDDMMMWMKGFKLPEDQSLEVQKKYLLKEKEKIAKVDESMRSAIDTAKKTLDENK